MPPPASAGGAASPRNPQGLVGTRGGQSGDRARQSSVEPFVRQAQSAEKDFGPSHQVVGGRGLGGVVAQPTDTGDKDHAYRSQGRKALGVVTRTAGQIRGRQAKLAGGVRDGAS